MFYKFKVWSREFAEGVINMLSDHPSTLLSSLNFNHCVKVQTNSFSFCKLFSYLFCQVMNCLGLIIIKKIALLK